MQWTRSDLIRADFDAVWQRTVDVERWPTFLPTVSSVAVVRRRDAEGLAPGDVVRIVQPGMTADWSVQVVEAPHRFVWATTWRGRPLAASHELASADGGTRNTLTLELGGGRSRWLACTVGPLLRMTLAREAKAFRRVLETPGCLPVG